MKCRFTHTNIIAKDWKRLSQFYQKVFGCVLVSTERDIQGDWIDQLTGIKKAHIRENTSGYQAMKTSCPHWRFFPMTIGSTVEYLKLIGLASGTLPLRWMM